MNTMKERRLQEIGQLLRPPSLLMATCSLENYMRQLNNLFGRQSLEVRAENK